eukprot:SM001165S25262  [mRNA]  locus=s1165:420:1331:+ [translate_table: standard]
MYAGLFLFALGLAKLTCSPGRFLVVAALGAFLDKKAAREEELCAEQFGQAYRSYQQALPTPDRFFGPLKPLLLAPNSLSNLKHRHDLLYVTIDAGPSPSLLSLVPSIDRAPGAQVRHLDLTQCRLLLSPLFRRSRSSSPTSTDRPGRRRPTKLAPVAQAHGTEAQTCTVLCNTA